MPVSEQMFEALRVRVTDLEKDVAVRTEGLKAIESRLGKIEGMLSRITWIIIGAIMSGVMAFILAGGLSAPIT